MVRNTLDVTAMWQRPSLQGMRMERNEWLGHKVFSENTRLVMITNRSTMHKEVKRWLNMLLMDLEL